MAPPFGLAEAIPSAWPANVNDPGFPGGPGGPGGGPAPALNAGYELYVRSAPGYNQLAAIIPRFMSLSFSKVLSDKGAGTVVFNLDDVFWQDATISLPGPTVPFVTAQNSAATTANLAAPVTLTSPSGSSLTVFAAANAANCPVSCSDSQNNPYFCVPTQLLSSNPYFQSGTGQGATGSLTGWQVTNGGTIALLPSAAVGQQLPSGAPTAFGCLYTSAGTAHSGVAQTAAAAWTAAVSTSYLATALVYSAIATTVRIGFDWYLSGVYVSTTATSIAVPAGWTGIGALITSPGSGINQAAVRCDLNAPVNGQQLVVLALAGQTPQAMQVFQSLNATDLRASLDSVTVAFGNVAAVDCEMMVLSGTNVAIQDAVDIAEQATGTSTTAAPGAAAPLQIGEVALLAVLDPPGNAPAIAPIVPYGASSGGSTVAATSFTTTLTAQINKNDLCVVEVGVGSPGVTVTAVSSTSIAGPAWNIVQVSNGQRPIFIAYAYAPVNLVSGTEQVTVTLSTSQNCGVVVFGLPNDGSGVYLDQNAGVASTTASVSVSAAPQPLVRSSEVAIGLSSNPNANGSPTPSGTITTNIAIEHQTSQQYVAAWYADVTSSSPPPTFTVATIGGGYDAGLVTFYRGWNQLAQLTPASFPILTIYYALITQAVTLNPQVPLASSGAWNAIMMSLMGSVAPPSVDLFNSEQLWQVYYNGFPVFEFWGETETYQLVDPSEQTNVTVTGPGTIASLAWASAMPPGFPDIVFKTDAIQDGFAEVNSAGALTVDAALWNIQSPAADVSLQPAGTLQIMASTGTTFVGATPYDLTNSLFSAQVVPLGQSIANLSGSGGSLPVLDGSQITQMYFQSNANSNNYILIGLTASGLYGKHGDAVKGAQVKRFGPYNSSTHAFWQISHAYLDDGVNSVLQWWVSSDGVNWTLMWEISNPSWQPTNGTVFFSAAYDVNNSQFMQVTNVNGNVVTPSSSGNVYFGEPIMGVWFSIFQQAQARGTIPFITTALNGVQDSFGNLWTDSNSVQIQNGTDLYSLLQSHTAIVDADYIMQPGFLLQVGLPVQQAIGGGPVALGFDRSGTVIVREAGAQASKQWTRDRSQIANLVGAVNSDGTTISASNQGSINIWGQRESWLQTAIQVNPTAILEAAQASVLQTENEILSYTVQINPNWPGATPWTNFNVGDWIGLEVPGNPAPIWQALWHGDGVTSGASIQFQRVAAVAGEVYTFEALVYSPQGWTGSSNGCGWFINWRNAAGASIGTSSQTANAVPIPAGNTNGTPVTFPNVQAPAGTAFADISLTAHGVPASSVQFFAAAGIQSLPNLTAIPNLTWTGTNGATTSQLAPWETGLSEWANSTIEVVRVMAIAVSVDATGGQQVELTIITYRQWLEEQLQYLVNKLGGQFVNSLGTSPVTSSAAGPTSLPIVITPTPPGSALSSASMQMHGAPLIFNSITGEWQSAGTIDPETGGYVTTTGHNLQTLHYSTASPQPGSLIASIAPVAGADDPGNTYAAGISVYQGSGFFVYSGQAAAGDLIVSIAGSAGTDAYGNTYPQGLQVNLAALISGVLAEFQQINLNPGPLLLYGDSNQVVVVLSGSGNWTAPAGVTSVQAFVQAAGGGNGGVTQGGGGAEFAYNGSVPVTPGNLYPYVVAPATTGTGGNSSFTGDSSVAVLAHGGASGAAAGQGGHGSTAPVHYNGGNGAVNIGNAQGGGGGGGAGSGGPGANGSKAGPGGSGGGGYWVGGNGGRGSNSGAGVAGLNFGGGAGGNTLGNSTLVAGGAGRILLVFTTSTGPQPLLASMAGNSGTDPISGGAYLPGLTTYDPTFGNIVEMFKGVLHWKLIPTFTVDATSLANQQGSGTVAYPGPYLTIGSPEQSGSTGQAGLTLIGGNTAGTRSSQVLINLATALPATTAMLEVQGSVALGSATIPATYTVDAAGYPTVTSAGGQFMRVMGSTGLGTTSQNTVTQAAFTNLTFGGIIASSTDAQVGSWWHFIVFGFGTWGSTQQILTFGIRFGAAATNTIGFTPAIAAAAFAASAAFDWEAEIDLMCVTTGATGTWRASIRGTVTQTANAINPGTAASNVVPFNGGTGGTDITLDTTVAENFGLSAKWASTTGAPTLTKTASTLIRMA